MDHSTARSTTIRTVIVDDEALARRGIEIRLQAHADFEIVAHCVNGREALEVIAREQPDLLFLDIQMPGLSGLDVLERLPQESMPMIVFVTAFDRYALNAFDAQALDYLLKPINDARFVQMLDRVRAWSQQRQALAQREQFMKLLAATKGESAIDTGSLRDHMQSSMQSGAQSGEPPYADILPIRDQSDTVRVNVSKIDWIDAAGDYMCVHAEGHTYVLRETMKSLEAILDPKIFSRVHRSTIVNVQRVRRLRPHTNGEYFLTLEDGQEIKLSRSYRDRVDQLLQRRQQ
jgi:two-component system LytT family response regulator